MAQLYTRLPAWEIARQVAKLINAHNRLRVNHSARSIMNSSATYFTEIYGDRIVGCQATIQDTDTVTRLFHLCVDPLFRRQGIARKLKRTALSFIETPFVYVTVREDNAASIALNISEGFQYIKKDWMYDHFVLVLAKDLRNLKTLEVNHEFRG